MRRRRPGRRESSAATAAFALLRPKHIVMATSVSGTPNIPKIATIENFAGKVLHSSQFSAGARVARQIRGGDGDRHQRA